MLEEIKFSPELGRLKRAEFEQIFDEKFKKAKSRMMRSFWSHPVTEELSGGAFSTNISNTLPYLAGANLYTFIGFESPFNPITDYSKGLAKLMEESKWNFVRYTNYGIVLNVDFNDTEDIFRKTSNLEEIPWYDGSWVYGIEHGIAGVGYYLPLMKSSESSRSLYGIQTKNQIRSGKFKNTAYVSRMIKQFKLDLGI